MRAIGEPTSKVDRALEFMSGCAESHRDSIVTFKGAQNCSQFSHCDQNRCFLDTGSKDVMPLYKKSKLQTIFRPSSLQLTKAQISMNPDRFDLLCQHLVNVLHVSILLISPYVWALVVSQFF